METQKNDEKNIVLELKRQLGRMMVQVDYMYRNDREMSRLDLDIMMEHTRELYDLLCDYGAGTNHDSPVDEVVDDEPIKTEINEGGELINRDVDFEIENEVHQHEKIEEIPEESKEIVDEPIDENPVEANDDSSADEIVDEPEKTVDEPTDEHVAEDDGEDWEDEDDEMFRVEKPVEEKQEEPEDNSLAARFQRTPITDIRMELGINDKVMIINELFMGSVERYNKSIDALNDFPTLSGARVYMSELQIELQWDTDSQAFRMLNDLVERRFI